MEKKKKHIKPSAELLRAIELYFECSLSEEEEFRLRQELASLDSSHPTVEEAKALMGFSTIKRVKPKAASDTSTGRKNIFHRRVAWAAASVAILFSAGMFLFPNQGLKGDQNGCIAYANGEKITDEEEVLNLLYENISELDRASEEAQELFIDDLDDLIPLTDGNLPPKESNQTKEE